MEVQPDKFALMTEKVVAELKSRQSAWCEGSLYAAVFTSKTSAEDPFGDEVQILRALQHSAAKAFCLNLIEAQKLPLVSSENENSWWRKFDYSAITPGADAVPAGFPLCAWLPFEHVDLLYSFNLLTICLQKNAVEICQKIWGDELLWVGLGEKSDIGCSDLRHALEENPQIKFILFEDGGLLVWGTESASCLANGQKALSEAAQFLTAQIPGYEEKPVASDEVLSSQILPVLRGKLSAQSPLILAQKTLRTNFLDGLDPLRLVEFLERFIGKIGSVTILDDLSTLDEEAVHARLNLLFSSPAGETAKITPLVLLIPEVGVIAAGKDHRSADQMAGSVAGIINAILRSKKLGSLKSPSVYLNPIMARQEISAAKEFTGKVAFITGAANGIGRATAWQFAREGAQVAIVDLNLEGAQIVADQIDELIGWGTALAVQCDVSDENAVQNAFSKTIQRFGGVDIVVSNAGFGLAKSITDTELKDWNQVQGVLGTGYFLVSREAFRTWIRQGTGGNLVFVCSKNSVRAGKDVATYSAAKASELHLARCLAEEGGQYHIRVNSVLPDAVLRGSTLFAGQFATGRAAAYGIKPDELQDYYIQRTTLKVPVYPENVAEAIVFFASERSSRTTGGALTVDGGVSAAYLR